MWGYATEHAAIEYSMYKVMDRKKSEVNIFDYINLGID